MRAENQHISWQIFEQSSGLSKDEQMLLEKAWEAAALAYAPYSRYFVGCAVLLVDGSVILGNNQENIAFPSGLCAERVALFHAGAMGKGDQIRKMAIRAASKRKEIDSPAMPCGACRQVMVQYEQMNDQPFILLSQGETGEILRIEGVQKNLLPLHFDMDF